MAMHHGGTGLGLSIVKHALEQYRSGERNNAIMMPMAAGLSDDDIADLAAFYASLLNAWPMGFYHPATLVKDGQRHGIAFHSVDVNRSGWRCRWEEGAVRIGLRFVHGIKVLMAKNYIDNLSEETRKGMTEKAEQGIWPSYAPFGYRNVLGENGKKTIEPDPELAPVVLQMFEWYATGQYSVKEVAAMTESRVSTTKSRILYARRELLRAAGIPRSGQDRLAHKLRRCGRICGRARRGGRLARAAAVVIGLLLLGGGVAFGPHPRDYGYNLPRKIKRVALKSALSDRAGHDR